MDFIERLFGISPDHGSGAHEAMLLVALVAIIALPLLLRARARR